MDSDPIEVKENIPLLLKTTALVILKTSIGQMTSQTTIVPLQSKLKLKIVTISPDQLKWKIKVTLNGNPLNLKAVMILIWTLILSLMLTQSMIQTDFEDLEAMNLDRCETFRAKIAASKPIPLFPFE